jgi:hypothetical protein
MSGDEASRVEPQAGEFENECFFITQIGHAGSDERQLSDDVRDAIVRPSASELGLVAVRADEIEEGGHITLQVLQHCTTAKVAVADLTGRNLNVYYEIGIRHALRQPIVLIAEEAERGQLPFDLLQQRTIFYTNDLRGATECRKGVTEQLRLALSGHVDSPVQAAANLTVFQKGDLTERTLADLVTKVEELLARAEPRPMSGDRPLDLGGLRFLAEHTMELVSLVAPQGDVTVNGELARLLDAVSYLLGDVDRGLARHLSEAKEALRPHAGDSQTNSEAPQAVAPDD